MFKVIEIAIDLTQPGSTTNKVETAINKLPKGSKFLGSCATESSVFIFYDVPTPPTSPPPT